MRRLLRAWLTRPSRLPRAPRAALALALAALAIVGLAAPPSSGQSGPSAPLAAAGGPPNPTPNAPDKSPEPPGPGDRVTSFPSSPALIAQGRGLYQNACSSCHGFALEGRAGIAPSLIGVGAGSVDFYLSTGRMPLQAPTDEPERTARPAYDRAHINALIAFVGSHGGPPAPGVDPAAGDLALGLHAFTLHCAGCHQIVGRGGLTLGSFVPDLQKASALQVAEAVRVGPYVMPHFGSKQINQRELDSIARYVLWTRNPDDAGGWGISNLGPIPEGIVAWFIALTALVIVARLIGERTA